VAVPSSWRWDTCCQVTAIMVVPSAIACITTSASAQPLCQVPAVSCTAKQALHNAGCDDRHAYTNKPHMATDARPCESLTAQLTRRCCVSTRAAEAGPACCLSAAWASQAAAAAAVAVGACGHGLAAVLLQTCCLSPCLCDLRSSPCSCSGSWRCCCK
jgi:hypothetical protein